MLSVKTEAQAFLPACTAAHSWVFSDFQTILLHQITIRKRHKARGTLIQRPCTFAWQLRLSCHHTLFPPWNNYKLDQFIWHWVIYIISYLRWEGKCTRKNKSIPTRGIMLISTVFTNRIRQSRAMSQILPLKLAKHLPAVAVDFNLQQWSVLERTQGTIQGAQSYFPHWRAAVKMWDSVSKFTIRKEVSFSA